MEFTTSVDPFTLLAGVGAGILVTVLVVVLLLFILQTVCIMKLYKKAGKPGIAAWIPFWNTWVMFDIAYGKGYLMFLYFIPPFVLPLIFFSYRDFLRAYGIGIGGCLLTLWVPFIMYPIYAFGSKTQYVGVDGIDPYGDSYESGEY